jgi:hypothetical protein
MCPPPPPKAPVSGSRCTLREWSEWTDLSSTSVPDGRFASREDACRLPFGAAGPVWQARDMLDESARHILDLEAAWWRHAATKEAAIRELFGEEPSAYYRRLGRLLDEESALAYAPVLVRRLRRQRARRLDRRSGRRLAS